MCNGYTKLAYNSDLNYRGSACAAIYPQPAKLNGSLNQTSQEQQLAAFNYVHPRRHQTATYVYMTWNQGLSVVSFGMVCTRGKNHKLQSLSVHKRTGDSLTVRADWRLIQGVCWRSSHGEGSRSFQPVEAALSQLLRSATGSTHNTCVCLSRGESSRDHDTVSLRQCARDNAVRPNETLPSCTIAEENTLWAPTEVFSPFVFVVVFQPRTLTLCNSSSQLKRCYNFI